MARTLNDLVYEFIDQDADASDCLARGISKDIFDKVMLSKRVSKLLEDLDINVPNKHDLFDVLDANLSGRVSLEELVAGLLKLRGGAKN